MNMSIYVVVNIMRDPAAINQERPELVKPVTSLDEGQEFMLRNHERMKTRNPRTYLRTEVYKFSCAGAPLAFAQNSAPKTTKVDARTFNRMRDPKPGEGSFELV